MIFFICGILTARKNGDKKMETYKKDVVYETILSNIVKKEVRDFMRGIIDYKYPYQIDVSMRPLTVACYIEFEALFTIDSKNWSLTGLMDRYGKISFCDLNCDGKLIYKFY